MFGYSVAELSGKSHLLLVPERHRETHRAYFRAFWGGTIDARLMGLTRSALGLHRDGCEFPIEIGLNRVATPNGTFVIALVAQTLRRKAESETAARSEIRAQVELCEHLGIPAAGIKTPNEIVSSNACFEEVRRFFLEFISLPAQEWLEESMGIKNQPARTSVQGIEGTVATAEINPSRVCGDMFLLRLTPTVFPVGKNLTLLSDSFGLTEAEARVAARSATGQKVPQIASELGVSKNTVRTHLAHVFEKIGVRSHAQLAARVSALRQPLKQQDQF